MSLWVARLAECACCQDAGCLPECKPCVPKHAVPKHVQTLEPLIFAAGGGAAGYGGSAGGYGGAGYGAGGGYGGGGGYKSAWD